MKNWNELMEERGDADGHADEAAGRHLSPEQAADPDAIVSADSGTIATWAARYIEIRDDMQFSLSGSLATMANGLPYSIGAAVAYPNRQVVCIVGDGGLTMLMGEIATLVKYKLNVKVIVIKNNTLGQIKWEQMVFEGNPEFGVDLQPIDFAGVAMNCGAAGFTIEQAGGGRGNSAPSACARRPRGRPGGRRSQRAAVARQCQHRAVHQIQRSPAQGPERWLEDSQDRAERPDSRGGVVLRSAFRILGRFGRPVSIAPVHRGQYQPARAPRLHRQSKVQGQSATRASRPW